MFTEHHSIEHELHLVLIVAIAGGTDLLKRELIEFVEMLSGSLGLAEFTSNLSGVVEKCHR